MTVGEKLVGSAGCWHQGPGGKVKRWWWPENGCPELELWEGWIRWEGQV